MKKLLMALAILAAVASAIVAAVFIMTGGVSRSGDRFLALVRDGRTHEAYLATARAFRTATSEQGFVAFLETSGVAGNRGAEWGSRSLSGSTGELEGSIRTRGGGAVPLKLKLVKEDGAWRVIAIEPLTAGIVTATGPSSGATPRGDPGLPPAAELQAMAKSAVLALGRAVTSRDFTELHASTAALWRRQTTPEALRGAFQSLIDQGADLSVVQATTAVLSGKPSIDGSDRLVLEGFFPSEPTRVGFTLKYIQEASAWKLVGINVQLEPARRAATPGVVPAERELQALAHDSMKLFAAAIAKDDFSEIHGQIASAWRQQMPLAEMRSTFHAFVEKRIPLTVVETSAPVFTEQANIDSNGILTLAGH